MTLLAQADTSTGPHTPLPSHCLVLRPVVQYMITGDELARSHAQPATVGALGQSCVDVVLAAVLGQFTPHMLSVSLEHTTAPVACSEDRVIYCALLCTLC